MTTRLFFHFIGYRQGKRSTVTKAQHTFKCEKILKIILQQKLSFYLHILEMQNEKKKHFEMLKMFTQTWLGARQTQIGQALHSALPQGILS